MIMEARGVPAGAGLTDYITRNERADIVKTNLLTDGLTYQGMWDEMHLHFKRFEPLHSRHPITYTAVELIASPAPEECKGWTRDDWSDYAEELVNSLDSVDEVTDKKGVVHSNLKKTTFANSKYFAGLHKDSKSGKLHLHLLLNRIDQNGNLNDLHYIGLRAVAAAEAINRRHGWKDPMEIHREHLDHINNACTSLLKGMDSFSVEGYISGLEKCGWNVKTQTDTKGVIHGYTIFIGNSPFKASDLGVGRCFTVKNLEKTWQKLRKEELEELEAQHPKVTQPERSKMNIIDRYIMEQAQVRTNARLSQQHDEEESAIFSSLISVKGKSYSISMPRNAYDALVETVNDNDYGNANKEDVINLAILLFVGYINAATDYKLSVIGGGGSASDWKKKDDEDDISRARRAAMKACTMCKPALRRGRK